MIFDTKKVPTKTEMISILENFGHDEPEIQRPLNFRIIKTIQKSATPIQKYVEKHTTDEDIVIGGSSAIYSQLGSFRRPKDLDVYTSHVLRLKTDVMNILRQKYHNVTAGNIYLRDGHRIVQILINGKPAVEIHHSMKSGTLIHVFSDEIHYDFKTQDPLFIGKMRYLRIGTVLAQKVKAIGENYYNASPLTGTRRRVRKDVRDYRKISKSLSRGRPISKSVNSNPFGLNDIGNFEITRPKQTKKSNDFMGLGMF